MVKVRRLRMLRSSFSSLSYPSGWRAVGSLLVACALLIVVQPCLSDAQQGGSRSTLRGGAPSSTANAASAGDAGLKQRIEQIEEQLVDVQVAIGTLQSLARGGGGAQGSGGRDPRIDSFETQVRALSAQLEQLTDRIRRLESGRQDPGSATGFYQRRGDLAPAPAPTFQSDPAPRPSAGGFGSLTVTPGNEGRNDQIGRVIERSGGNGGESSKNLYETAYGYLLQQNYGAAEAAFSDFLQRFPGDPLAGNAQYWLGEAYYVRGNYKSAAAAFLKGYEQHRDSSKAPDSLLKLAMSLDRLGQKQAACSSYAELTGKFPNAPVHVRNRAASERRRLGC